MASFLGRVQYSFNERYLLTLSGRYDGSSRLAAGNQWAFFPSAALAWRMSEEDFLKDFEQLSNLKLRISYGTTGNDAVDIYGTQSGISLKNMISVGLPSRLIIRTGWPIGSFLGKKPMK